MKNMLSFLKTGSPAVTPAAVPPAPDEEELVDSEEGAAAVIAGLIRAEYEMWLETDPDSQKGAIEPASTQGIVSTDVCCTFLILFLGKDKENIYIA